MPSARTAAGSPSWTRDPRDDLVGHGGARTARPCRVTWPRFRIGMMPGRIGIVDADRRGPLDELEVVGHPEHHVGDRELRTGAPAWPAAPRRRGRATSEDGWPPGNAATPTENRPAGELDQLAGVGEPALGRGPLRPRALLRVAAQREHVGDAGLGERVEDRLELLAGVADAGQVAHRHHRGLARDPPGDVDGRVAGAAAGAVRHGDEGRLVGLQRRGSPATAAPHRPRPWAGRTRTRTTAHPHG